VDGVVSVLRRVISAFGTGIEGRIGRPSRAL
jgi:hypothetical protein